MAGHAARCIAVMDEQGLDFTMLWLVKHWDWLGRFKFGNELLAWIDRMDLHRQEVCCKEFHDKVTRVFKERGVRKIAPQRMVWAIRKADLYEQAEKQKWPRPYCPFMIQTRPPELSEDELKARGGFKRAGVFVMFSNWQDGFFKILEIAGCSILKDQSGRPLRDFRGEVHQVAVLYENQITRLEGVDYPCRIILDCDLKCADYQGKCSLEDMIKSTEQVPIWFVRRLMEIRAIKRADTVVVIEKDKSRPGKVSKHYTFNIIGLSKGDIFSVLDLVFKQPFLADKKSNLTVTARVVPGELISPIEIADTTTMHGNNQFSVMLLHHVKKGETKNPVQTAEIRISRGGEGVERVETPWAHMANDPEHPDAMWMLFKSCYSNFTPNSITMDPRFMTLFHEGEPFILTQSLL